MGRVLSYFKKEGPLTIEEYLSEHINDCVRLFEKLSISKMGRAGMLYEGFLDAVRFSVIFHDLGKAFYQRRGESISFAGHEIFSTHILYQFYDKLLEENPDEYNKLSRILKPALFAVMFHHHPMDVGKRLERIGKIELTSNSLRDLQYELSLLSDGALCAEERSALNSVIVELEHKIQKKELRSNDIKRQFSDSIGHMIYVHFTSMGEEDIIIKRVSYMTLTALIIIDYMSANRRRKGRSRFGKIAEEFYRLYFNS